MIPLPRTIRSKHPVHALPCPRAVEPAASATDTATPPAAARGRHSRTGGRRCSGSHVPVDWFIHDSASGFPPRQRCQMVPVKSPHPTTLAEELIIYIISVTLLPDLKTKMVLERIEAHDVVPSIRVLDKCVHYSCSSLLKLVLV